jgi:hypothetical protein
MFSCSHGLACHMAESRIVSHDGVAGAAAGITGISRISGGFGVLGCIQRGRCENEGEEKRASVGV